MLFRHEEYKLRKVHTFNNQWYQKIVDNFALLMLLGLLPIIKNLSKHISYFKTKKKMFLTSVTLDSLFTGHNKTLLITNVLLKYRFLFSRHEQIFFLLNPGCFLLSDPRRTSNYVAFQVRLLLHSIAIFLSDTFHSLRHLWAVHGDIADKSSSEKKKKYYYYYYQNKRHYFSAYNNIFLSVTNNYILTITMVNLSLEIQDSVLFFFIPCFTILIFIREFSFIWSERIPLPFSRYEYHQVNLLSVDISSKRLVGNRAKTGHCVSFSGNRDQWCCPRERKIPSSS